MFEPAQRTKLLFIFDEPTRPAAAKQLRVVDKVRNLCNADSYYQQALGVSSSRALARRT